MRRRHAILGGLGLCVSAAVQSAEPTPHDETTPPAAQRPPTLRHGVGDARNRAGHPEQLRPAALRARIVSARLWIDVPQVESWCRHATLHGRATARVFVDVVLPRHRDGLFVRALLEVEHLFAAERTAVVLIAGRFTLASDAFSLHPQSACPRPCVGVRLRPRDGTAPELIDTTQHRVCVAVAYPFVTPRL